MKEQHPVIREIEHGLDVLYEAIVPRKNFVTRWTIKDYDAELKEILNWIDENTTPNEYPLVACSYYGQMCWRQLFNTHADAMLFFLRWGSE